LATPAFWLGSLEAWTLAANIAMPYLVGVLPAALFGAGQFVWHDGHERCGLANRSATRPAGPSIAAESLATAAVNGGDSVQCGDDGRMKSPKSSSFFSFVKKSAFLQSRTQNTAAQPKRK
jgi:hypothetical protein